MRRRDFITLLCGAAVASPLAARAQQPAMPVVGFLSSGAEQAFAPNVAGFLRRLRETGYIQGQNVAIEYRWADSHYDRLSAMATELVRQRVAVLVASGGTAVARAAKGATRTIPIVFSTADDPVANGIVGSMNRPGENITGVALLSTELAGKFGSKSSQGPSLGAGVHERVATVFEPSDRRSGQAARSKWLLFIQPSVIVRWRTLS